MLFTLLERPVGLDFREIHRVAVICIIIVFSLFYSESYEIINNMVWIYSRITRD